MGRDVSLKRLHRMRTIIGLFDRRIGYPKRELMDLVGYRCDRTLERDLKLLRERLGIDVRYDTMSRRYRLSGVERVLISAELSVQEVTALSMAIQMARSMAPHMGDHLESIDRKLKGQVPEALMDRGRQLGRSALPCACLPTDEEMFLAMADCIRDHKRVMLRRRRGGNVLMDPWSLPIYGAVWHVRGYDVLRSREAAYPLNVFSSWEVLGSGEFVPPSMVRSDGVTFKVKLSLPLPDRVAQSLPLSRLEEEGDGGVFMGWAMDPEQVVRWAIASFPHVRLLEPRELVNRLRDAAGEIF